MSDNDAQLSPGAYATPKPFAKLFQPLNKYPGRDHIESDIVTQPLNCVEFAVTFLLYLTFIEALAAFENTNEAMVLNTKIATSFRYTLFLIFNLVPILAVRESSISYFRDEI
jgi:hypothetical protein